MVPAHNERAHLPRCLRALTTAALCYPAPVLVVVVLDSCDDGSEHLAGQFGHDVHFVSVDVGECRRGAGRRGSSTRGRCAAEVPERSWYATTDADSVVEADWLVRMTDADADAVLGVVRLSNWRHFPAEVIRRHLRAYQSNGPGHKHIHGANMGFRADVYWNVGGFHALETGEDVDLVGRLQAAGAAIHRDGNLSVATSARRHGRAPGGFAEHLRGLSSSALRRGSRARA